MQHSTSWLCRSASAATQVICSKDYCNDILAETSPHTAFSVETAVTNCALYAVQHQQLELGQEMLSGSPRVTSAYYTHGVEGTRPKLSMSDQTSWLNNIVLKKLFQKLLDQFNTVAKTSSLKIITKEVVLSHWNHSYQAVHHQSQLIYSLKHYIDIYFIKT